MKVYSLAKIPLWSERIYIGTTKVEITFSLRENRGCIHIAVYNNNNNNNNDFIAAHSYSENYIYKYLGIYLQCS